MYIQKSNASKSLRRHFYMTCIALFAILASGKKEMISGRVLLPDGSPSSNTSVALQISGFDGWKLGAQTSTLRDGSFVIAVKSLDPARTQVVIRRKGYAMLFARIGENNSIGSVELTKGASVAAQFVDGLRSPVAKTLIRVREVVRHRPDGRETVYATAPELAPSWRTDSAGRCVLEDLEPGDDVRLEVESDRFSRLSDDQAVHVDPQGKPMSIRYDLGWATFISGRVWMDGHPVPGIRLVATSRGGSKAEGMTESRFDGRYQINRLPPGTYSVQALLPPNLVGEPTATAYSAIELRPGFFQSAVDFNLVLGPTIMGTVTDGEGHALVGQIVNFYNPAHPKSTFVPGYAITDQYGRYKIRALPGDQEIWLDVQGSMSRTLTIREGETRTIDLSASQASK